MEVFIFIAAYTFGSIAETSFLNPDTRDIEAIKLRWIFAAAFLTYFGVVV